MLLQRNISLLSYNTFHIQAKASYFSAFVNVEQIKTLLEEAFGKHLAAQTLVLGGGSNILFTADFDGLVLKNEVKGIAVVAEDEQYVYVKAGAGENWHSFVKYCIAHNFCGIENLALIPGNVGASPMQNIGAYGVEIKDVFHQLEAFHIQDKEIRIFNLEDCQFGYRESVFKRKYKDQFVIMSVTYRLRKTPVFITSYGALQQELEKMGVQQLNIQDIAQAIINIRTSKLPDWKVTGNAGSFFKNPQISNSQFEKLQQEFPTVVGYPQEGGTKLAAGWLIEQCGWKGYRKGDAGCYSKQALVLVNYGTATGAEMYNLSQQIIESVQQKFGVTLEREVNIV